MEAAAGVEVGAVAAVTEAVAVVAALLVAGYLEAFLLHSSEVT